MYAAPEKYATQTRPNTEDEYKTQHLFGEYISVENARQ